MDAALSFLSYRPRTRDEVRRRLGKRGFDEELVALSIERLSSVGLLDDVAFVETYVRDRVAHRPMGLRRLCDELYAKGVTRETAVPIIERVFGEDEVSERELASRVVEKKLGRLRASATDERTLRRRLTDHLVRRGFAPGLVREVIEDALPGD